MQTVYFDDPKHGLAFLSGPSPEAPKGAEVLTESEFQKKHAAELKAQRDRVNEGLAEKNAERAKKLKSAGFTAEQIELLTA